jgi:hypothetical protein
LAQQRARNADIHRALDADSQALKSAGWLRAGISFLEDIQLIRLSLDALAQLFWQECFGKKSLLYCKTAKYVISYSHKLESGQDFNHLSAKPFL